MIKRYPYRADHTRPYTLAQREAGQKLADMVDEYLAAHPELVTPRDSRSPTPLELTGGIVDATFEAAVAKAGYSQDGHGQFFFKTGTTKGTNAKGEDITIPLAVVVPVPAALTEVSNKRAVVQL